MSNIFDLFKKIEKKEEINSPISYIMAGLGNPGSDYINTRHNAGFSAIDYIADRCGVKIDRLRFNALTAEATVSGARVLLLKPQTYMNLSGEAISKAASFYKIPPENILVLCDDISFGAGKFRIRRKGSAGGHNGLKSIISCLGSDNFPRIRFGVGKKPHPDYDMADWVLGNLSEEDKKAIFDCFVTSYEGLEKLLQGNVDEAMQICNSKK